MIDEMEFLTQLVPFFIMLLSLIVSLILKDVITNFFRGLAFRMNPLIREGDLVFVDGDAAIVLKIGIRATVFGLERSNGDYCWRSVDNSRIPYLKIEKVVRAGGTAHLGNVPTPNLGDFADIKEKLDSE
jgi:hypothetical protein